MTPKPTKAERRAIADKLGLSFEEIERQRRWSWLKMRFYGAWWVRLWSHRDWKARHHALMVLSIYGHVEVPWDGRALDIPVSTMATGRISALQLEQQMPVLLRDGFAEQATTSPERTYYITDKGRAALQDSHYLHESFNRRFGVWGTSIGVITGVAGLLLSLYNYLKDLASSQ